MPKLELVNLEAQFKAAEAGAGAAPSPSVTAACVRAPWDGHHHRHPARSAARASRCTGPRDRARWSRSIRCWRWSRCRSASWPASRSANAAEVRLVTGQKAMGRVRYVAKTASQTTRTYRVEVELPNADGAIPDGITAEVAIPLAPVPATRVPRSALTFSSGGDLGVRVVGRRRQGRFRPGQRGRGRPESHVGRRHCRWRPRDRAGPGFRARRPEGGGGAGRSRGRSRQALPDAARRVEAG